MTLAEIQDYLDASRCYCYDQTFADATALGSLCVMGGGGIPVPPPGEGWVFGNPDTGDTIGNPDTGDQLGHP